MMRLDSTVTAALLHEPSDSALLWDAVRVMTRLLDHVGMVKSPWVYRLLRNFRAGIEASISCFKRAYGAARCTWRGLQHFKAYIWSEVVAHNLTLFARLKPT
jgi:transposase, IS5 family